jgi:hypothetical protein
MEEMKLSNQIYNGDFLLSYADRPGFPDGWESAGGDSQTTWEWLGPPEGPRAVRINHPNGPRASIIQSLETVIQAEINQRWEFQILLESNSTGVLSYLKIYMGNVAQKVSTLYPTDELKWFSKIFATPIGAGAIRVEVGVIGEGQLTIHEIKASRLYPQRSLKLDDHGQVYVKHVDTIGQIQRPVAVKLVHPLPLPVDLKATITEDIRNLTPLRDGVRIYDSAANTIVSTPEGALKIQLNSRRFVDSRESIVADLSKEYTAAKDVSELTVYSFAIKNRGVAPALIHLEISPDGEDWAADSLDLELQPGQLRVLVPQTFLRYIRVSYRAESTVPLNVWFQAQC